MTDQSSPTVQAPDGLGGLVIIDKPKDFTSHDVVARLRRLLGTRKVGHAGTLDPMATGVLICGVGRATRLLGYVSKAPKTYTATIRLGIETDTEDAAGQVVSSPGFCVPEDFHQQLDPAIQGLTGQIQQVPSAVSAIKIDGQRAYQRVRAGEDVQLPARAVTVSRFDVIKQRQQSVGEIPVIDLDVIVECSSGTYIRALARDLAVALGTVGHLTELCRTVLGGFSVSDAVPLPVGEDTTAPLVMPLAEVLPVLFDVLTVDDATAIKLKHGNRIDWPSDRDPAAPLAVMTTDGVAVCLADKRDDLLAVAVGWL